LLLNEERNALLRKLAGRPASEAPTTGVVVDDDAVVPSERLAGIFARIAPLSPRSKSQQFTTQYNTGPISNATIPATRKASRRDRPGPVVAERRTSTLFLKKKASAVAFAQAQAAESLP